MKHLSIPYSAILVGALACSAVWVSPAVAWPEEGRAMLLPTVARVAPGSTQQFRAIQLPRRMQVSEPARLVTWTVDGVPGGNDVLGRIDAQGLYRAPSLVPSPGLVHIAAEVPDAANRVLHGTVLLSGEPRYRSESHWPPGALREAGLEKPLRIALDSTGHVLIADAPSGRVGQFTRNGASVGAFGKGPRGETPSGVCMLAVSPSGSVYLGDLMTGPPRINVFNPAGAWQFGFAPKGSRPGMVMQPAGLAFHPDGRFYLADMDAMRLSIFDANHEFLRFLKDKEPEGNRVNFPSDAAFDDAGDLFIASAFGPCEKVNAETGERVLAFAWPEPPDGLMYIDDVCVDRWGDVFLAVRSAADPVQSGPFEGGVASILKYTNTGEFLTSILLAAAEPAWISVAVDENGRVYAAYATESAKVPEAADEPAETGATKETAKKQENKISGGVEVFVLE